MAEGTKISWADDTFNPWVGCTKVSPACDHCYAEGWAKRTGSPGLWQGERRRTSAANWRKPRQWNADAAHAGDRRRVFCASLADVFDNQVPSEWRDDLWALIRQTPNLDWLLLTKRPQNIAKMLPADWGDGYPNVWLGTTVENQAEADRRVPHLLAAPARLRFLSCEPLLGPVDLHEYLLGFSAGHPADCTCGHGHGFTRCPNYGSVAQNCHWRGCECTGFRKAPGGRGLHWVITGGESGPGARPSHPDWFRSLRDQCAAAGVAFHMKQWGEWAPEVGAVDGWTIGDDPEISRFEHRDWDGDHWSEPYARGWQDDIEPDTVSRIGTKRSGHHLDGVEHRAVPA